MKNGLWSSIAAEPHTPSNRCAYVLPYLEQPEFVQVACETIVELAHHRELREPNKSEFDPSLDKVIKLNRDAVVVDRANRYKQGETWERPKPSDGMSSQ